MWNSHHYLQLDGGVIEDVSVTAECGWKWGGCVPCEDAAHLHRMTVTIIQTQVSPQGERTKPCRGAAHHPDRHRAGGGTWVQGASAFWSHGLEIRRNGTPHTYWANFRGRSELPGVWGPLRCPLFIFLQNIHLYLVSYSREMPPLYKICD